MRPTRLAADRADAKDSLPGRLDCGSGCNRVLLGRLRRELHWHRLRNCASADRGHEPGKLRDPRPAGARPAVHQPMRRSADALGSGGRPSPQVSDLRDCGLQPFDLPGLGLFRSADGVFRADGPILPPASRRAHDRAAVGVRLYLLARRRSRGGHMELVRLLQSAVAAAIGAAASAPDGAATSLSRCRHLPLCASRGDTGCPIPPLPCAPPAASTAAAARARPWSRRGGGAGRRAARRGSGRRRRLWPRRPDRAGWR